MLGDYALKPHLASGLQEGGTIGVHFFGQPDRAFAHRYKIFEQSPAFVEGHPREVVAIEIEKIEGIEDHFGAGDFPAAATAQGLLQGVKIRAPLAIENHGFTVENEGRGVDRLDGARN
ncbi:hypothetical protein GCM10011499_38420 [Pelagibacterium lentulum]|uniref:Uncharacterized protein n=1 Tax=Pelagibacterium lentulum TaxID=2029865 RepID=A0A916W471_9HYPH|nr:hypothetical protein GCM10011499_38420 [Pelagibacterium lentulum]